MGGQGSGREDAEGVDVDNALGGRVHPQIAWAKLESLAKGAGLATKQLWP
jgi:5-methyltetrahydropteroyltriglutamate--homocysteine methyltransferase